MRQLALGRLRCGRLALGRLRWSAYGRSAGVRCLRHLRRLARVGHSRVGGGGARAKGVTADWSAMADEWRREGYIRGIARIRAGEMPYVGSDVLFSRKLDELLPKYGRYRSNRAETHDLAHAWRRLDPWPDTVPGLTQLKTRFFISPLSNGSFPTLTSMAKRAAMPWDCIITTELRQTFKPNREAYLLAAELLDLAPDQVMLVAAHDNDLRGAQAAGLHTALVPRPARVGAECAGAAAAGPVVRLRRDRFSGSRASTRRLMAELDATQIQALIPHRYPFLLVDRILELEPGKRAVGLKHVSMSDHYLQGHFPELPGDAGRADRRGAGPDRRRAGHAGPCQCGQNAVLRPHRQLPLSTAGATGRHAAPGGRRSPRFAGRSARPTRGHWSVAPWPARLTSPLRLATHRRRDSAPARPVAAGRARAVWRESDGRLTRRGECCCYGRTTSATCC